MLLAWIRTLKSEMPIKRPLSLVVLSVLVLSLSSMCVTMSAGLVQAEVFQCIRFASSSWMALAFVVFCSRFTGFSAGAAKGKKRSAMLKGAFIALFILVAADIALLCTNFLSQGLYRMDSTYIPYVGLVYTFYEAGPLMLFHIGLLALMLLLAGYILWKKVIETTGFDKVQYVLVMILMAVTLVFEMVNFRFHLPLDCTLGLYTLLAIFVCWFPIIYVPHYLFKKMISKAVSNESLGLICYSVGGECIYANEVIRNLLPMARSNEEIAKEFTRWLEVEEYGNFDNCMLKKVDPVKGTSSYYDVERVTLLSKGGSKLGVFFNVQDRTVSVNRLERERFANSHDSLTGVYTRDYFYEKAETLVEENPDVLYYMMCSNIKDFKLINSLFGTETGDRILKQLAHVMIETIQPGAAYGRIGDDHFALLIPEDRFDEDLFMDALQNVGNMLDAENFRFHISIGIYEVTDRNIPASIMCDRAAMALKTISGDLRFTFAYYVRSMMEEVLHEKRMVGEFERAIAENDFRVFLQPQMNTDGRMIGAEALVRWIHPEWGLIPPVDCIPVFEKTGLIHRMDAYVWEEACKILANWQEKGNDYYISVNISPRDLYYVDLYKVFTELVEKYRLDVSRLHLELTETALMTDPQKQILLIQRLRDYGFRVEIDDFGSGYSSLNLLKDIEVDVLKLDMEFIRQTEHVKRSRLILEMIMQLSKALHMSVVVEGVEAREQFEYLRGLGCETFQGYYFGKPMERIAFEEKYCN